MSVRLVLVLMAGAMGALLALGCSDDDDNNADGGPGGCDDLCESEDTRNIDKSYCYGLSVDECAHDNCCVVTTGDFIDDALGCLKLEQPAGCKPCDTECHPTETYVRDPEGRLWRFANDCTPKGWTGDVEHESEEAIKLRGTGLCI
jgi:hypothetical protein